MWRKLGLMTLLSMSGYLYAADIALTMRAEKLVRGLCRVHC